MMATWVLYGSGDGGAFLKMNKSIYHRRHLLKIENYNHSVSNA